jgi:hypothetical protein
MTIREAYKRSFNQKGVIADVYHRHSNSHSLKLWCLFDEGEKVMRLELYIQESIMSSASRSFLSMNFIDFPIHQQRHLQ